MTVRELQGRLALLLTASDPHTLLWSDAPFTGVRGGLLAPAAAALLIPAGLGDATPEAAGGSGEAAADTVAEAEAGVVEAVSPAVRTVALAVSCALPSGSAAGADGYEQTCTRRERVGAPRAASMHGTQSLLASKSAVSCRQDAPDSACKEKHIYGWQAAPSARERKCQCPSCRGMQAGRTPAAWTCAS